MYSKIYISVSKEFIGEICEDEAEHQEVVFPAAEVCAFWRDARDRRGGSESKGYGSRSDGWLGR